MQMALSWASCSIACIAWMVLPEARETWCQTETLHEAASTPINPPLYLKLDFSLPIVWGRQPSMDDLYWSMCKQSPGWIVTSLSFIALTLTTCLSVDQHFPVPSWHAVHNGEQQCPILENLLPCILGALGLQHSCLSSTWSQSKFKWPSLWCHCNSYLWGPSKFWFISSATLVSRHWLSSNSS
jgi:hypothetical protein